MTAVLLISMSLMLFPADERDDVSERLDHAAEVINELLNAADAEVPEGLIDDAECVAVISFAPRVAFGFERESGHGPVSCRDDSGWSAPSMLVLEASALSFWIGVRGDMVLLFMVEESVEYLNGNEAPFGRVDPGPKSRALGTSTDFTSESEILSYSQERGFFARIELPYTGGRASSRWGPDRDANTVLYGRAISAEEILLQGTPVPVLATEFMAAIRSN